VTLLSAFIPNSVLNSGSRQKLGSLGFRRWYERQLIESHLWLTLCFCSIVAFAAGLELLGERRTASDLLVNALIALSGLAVGGLSWRKYAGTMVMAESIGKQAVCAACKHYGFRLLPKESESKPAGSATSESALRVRCTQCSHQWELQT
jgi:hypothetical protein